MIIKSCFFMSLAVMAGIAFGQARAEERELIQDKQFQRGFILSKTEPGKEIHYGELKGVVRDTVPVWGMYQWSSRFPLDTSKPAEESDGLLVFSNSAKSVGVGSSEEKKGVLSLAANTREEYGSRARIVSDPWVHLLVHQTFDAAEALSQLSAVKVRVDARLLRSRNLHTNDYSPDVHAAQFQIFLTLANQNRQSAGYGDYLWFGVPIYDSRDRFPKAFKEQDFGGTAKYIFTMDGKTFTESSAHDGEWIVIEKDVLPLMHEALESAWTRGFLKDSKNIADYRISYIVMGWELPGTFDVEMQVKNLSIKTVRKNEEPLIDERGKTPVSLPSDASSPATSALP